MISESKIGEIIAMTWTIVWVLLYYNNAPTFVLWCVGLKALIDHLMSIYFAFQENSKK